MTEPLANLEAAIAACRICRDEPMGGALPHEPRPVAWPSATARILVAGQAPGIRVHLSGRPFTDPSGERLRFWMGVEAAQFYDRSRVAVVPMGFCFPGHDAKGGDLPPRRECRLAWHDRLMAAMPQVDLILAIGAPAQAYHLGRLGLSRFLGPSMTRTVEGWRDLYEASASPRVVVLPHPSWRNSGWLNRNPWFAADLLPVLRREVAARIGPIAAPAG